MSLYSVQYEVRIVHCALYSVQSTLTNAGDVFTTECAQNAGGGMIRCIQSNT